MPFIIFRMAKYGPVSYTHLFMADPHLKDTFVEGDIRLPLFQWMREGYLGYKKFHMRADDTADLVLMRAAEMYLIEAEANVRDGMELSQAVIPLNTLRNARGVVDYDVAGKSREDVINEILLERRRELWGCLLYTSPYNCWECFLFHECTTFH